MNAQLKSKIESFNRLLLEAGFEERIYVSPGYWYFMGGDSARWKETGVFGMPFTEVTIEQVILKLKEFQAENRKIIPGSRF